MSHTGKEKQDLSSCRHTDKFQLMLCIMFGAVAQCMVNASNLKQGLAQKMS